MSIIQDNNSKLYRDLIVLYCPEKVGSSSIVSSIKLYASDKFMIFHTHENKIADIVNYKINTINVSDILLNNQVINPYTNQHRQIYLIDIFRTPIERKISFFFQKISEIHFNNTETNISNYSLDKIIKRFNDIFIHLDDIDYFNEYYECEKITQFDFENKFIYRTNNNVHYIKLRLQDSNDWGDILSKILKTKIHILNDYNTTNKNIGQLYSKFINQYKLPYNYYKLIQNDKLLNIYMNDEEKSKYLKKWLEKISKDYIPFTSNEYIVYKKISNENIFYSANNSNKHYYDDGCLCLKCSQERKNVIYELEQGNVINPSIKHSYNDTYDNYIFLKIFPFDDKNISFDSTINLINF